MRITAIISEYNPLHKGHAHHIAESRRLSGADAIICIMSGNFTQRGEIACMDKYTRARHAILAGADCVIELPSIYATSGADYFAKGGVEVINAIKDCTHLSFGSECGNVDELIDIYKVSQSLDYNTALRTAVESGLSYPKASELAYTSLGISYNSKPNNTLGIAYISALMSIAPHIKPMTIKRIGSDYHDKSLGSGFASATAIRDAIACGSTTTDYLPSYVSDDMSAYNNGDYNRLFSIIASKLLGNLPSVYEDNEGLVNRAIKALSISNSYTELLDNIHSKRYTKSRIARFLIHIAAEHTPSLLACNHDYHRVLALRDSMKDVILPRLMPLESTSPLYANDVYGDKLYAILTGYRQLNRKLQLI